MERVIHSPFLARRCYAVLTIGSRLKAPGSERSYLSGVAQRLADAHRLSLVEHGGAKRDVRQRQAAMPEQYLFPIVLAAGLFARHNLAELAVKSRLADESGVDMRP